MGWAGIQSKVVPLLGAMATTLPNADTTPIPAGILPDAAPVDATDPGSSIPQLSVGSVQSTADAGSAAALALAQGKRGSDTALAEAGVAAKDAETATKAANQAEYDAKVKNADLLKPEADDYLHRLASIETDYNQVKARNDRLKMRAFDDAMRANTDFANTRIHSWYSQASTGATALGIISQLLAGAVQGSTGNLSGNTPMDRVIENDLAVQKANLQTKGQAAEMKRGAYRDILDQVKDDALASDMLRNAAWVSYQHRAQAIVDAAPENMKAIYAANKAKLDAEAVQKRAALTVGIQEKINDSFDKKSAMALEGAFGLRKLQQQDTALTLDAAAKAQAGANSEMRSGVPGVAGAELLPQSDKDKIREAVGTKTEMSDLITELKATVGSKLSVLDKRNQINKLKNRYILSIRKLAGLGVLSAADIQLAAETAGRTFDNFEVNPLKLNVSTSKDQLQAADSLSLYVDRQLNNKLKTYSHPQTGQPLRYAPPEGQ